MLMYRYRSMESIIKFKEIENQEIFFSEIKNLNDPMEGYFVPFYKGDVSHWQMFFEKYIYKTIIDYVEIRCNKICFDKEKIYNMTNECMKSNTLNRLMERLGNIKVHIAGYDFRYFMQYYIHPFTFFCVSLLVENELGYADIKTVADLKSKSQKIVNDILDANMIENIIFFINDKRLERLKIIVEEWKKFTYEGGSKILLIPRISSCSKIIDDIEREYKVDFLSASYTTRNDNASMWSHYANMQNGVCLGFDVHADKNGIYALFEKNNKKIYYSKVNYTNELLNLDTAFDMLKLMDLPYCSAISDALGRKVIEEQKSLYRYKMKDWSYENEYRLIVPKVMIRGQKLKYNLSELKEIIFGNKVGFKEKKQIIDIIDAKSKKIDSGSYDVKFYNVTSGWKAPMLDFVYQIK